MFEFFIRHSADIHMLKVSPCTGHRMFTWLKKRHTHSHMKSQQGRWLTPQWSRVLSKWCVCVRVMPTLCVSGLWHAGNVFTARSARVCVCSVNLELFAWWLWQIGCVGFLASHIVDFPVCTCCNPAKECDLWVHHNVQGRSMSSCSPSVIYLAEDKIRRKSIKFQKVCISYDLFIIVFVLVSGGKCSKIWMQVILYVLSFHWIFFIYFLPESLFDPI